MYKIFIQLLLLIFPWTIRRRLLEKMCNYVLHPTSRIGFSVLIAGHVNLGMHARIGSLNLFRGLDQIVLETNAIIGNMNWIAGVPSGVGGSFGHFPGRMPALILRHDSALTHRHLLDCTDLIEVGPFSTVAGWGSQILTHGIDIKSNMQSCAPVRIESYCFVGTKSVLLKGSVLPARSVLAAGSVLAHAYSEQLRLYSGVPALPSKELDSACLYFHRLVGAVS